MLGGCLSLLALSVAIRRQRKHYKAAALVLLCHGSFLQGFEAMGRATGPLEVDLILAGGFAGGFSQTAVSHEMVLWDKGMLPGRRTGPSLRLYGTGHYRKLIFGFSRGTERSSCCLCKGLFRGQRWGVSNIGCNRDSPLNRKTKSKGK